MRMFGEYVNLAQITMLHVLGSVEDERTFSSLKVLKILSEIALTSTWASLWTCMLSKFITFRLFYMTTTFVNGSTLQRLGLDMLVPHKAAVAKM